MPFQLATGVKVNAPLAAIVRLPTPAMAVVWPADLVTPPTVKVATESASPSMSASLVRTLPVTAVSSEPAKTSAEAVGASLTGVTVRARLDVVVSAPSVTVTAMVGTEPFQLVAGVKTYLPSTPRVK